MIYIIALHLGVGAAKTAPSSAGASASPHRNIAPSPRRFWKRANSAWPVTPHARARRARTKTFVTKLKRLRGGLADLTAFADASKDAGSCVTTDGIGEAWRRIRRDDARCPEARCQVVGCPWPSRMGVHG